MATAGQELKRERELRGISLKEIADSTKINMRFLQALENDQMDFLPGKFFTKGIIRTYADYIGLEADKILNIYYETLRREQEEEEREENSHSSEAKDIKNRSRIQSAAWIIFVLAVFLIVFFIFKDRLIPRENEHVVIFSRTAIPPPHPPDLRTLIETERIHLDIFFEELTWLRVYADGKLVLDGLQPAGKKTAVFASSRLVINTGNAGGMVYSINGQPGRRLGKSGEVVNDIRMTPDNWKDFINRK